MDIPSGPPSHVPQKTKDMLYGTLLQLFPEADQSALHQIATAACRSVHCASRRSNQHSEKKLALYHVLRSAGSDPNQEQIESVYTAVHAYTIAIDRASSDAPSSGLSGTVLATAGLDCLLKWNDEAATGFEQILLASHAGTRYCDQLPNQCQRDVLSTVPSTLASSATNPTFSPSWLRLRCIAVPSVNAGTLSPSEMALSVYTLLADESMSDEAIQGHLFDAFAGDFDAVADVLQHRAEIQTNADAILADCNQATQIEGLSGLSAAPRQRGVAARRERTVGQDRLSAQVTVRDRGREAQQKGLERNSRRLAKAGLLKQEQEADFDLSLANLGSGSGFEERNKAFPGIQLDGDRMIGAVERVGLPRGSTREVGKGYEEIFVPPPQQNQGSGNLIEISSALSQHPELLQTMKGISRLNRLQSAVYPVAFLSNENLLVCAPTGAGKTNVALLTILREIAAVKRREQKSFKVVYVAPMKALAAEITEKFGNRLSSLGLRVREFTGDMSLSRAEAIDTHVLVTTPEKWDVVTRKSGSDLSESVTLFIIDEIHLLHDDRGAVLESIVARTLRLSETAQRRIRLVGLSATLPNYADVGSFMRVDPDKGLFHFDGSHRPVPLSQTFIGITEGENSNSNEARRRRQNKMHEMAWKKVKDSLQRGHQAMIFVHSRKGTGKAAREMLHKATQDACDGIFLGEQETTATTGVNSAQNEPHDGPRELESSLLPTWAAKEISKSRTADVRELCARGVGIHNAGLPRPDRKLVERLFAQGVIRLLCCTATLAWGINLPARTVVIMGTEVYSAEKGGFVQLGMLDVMQVFGRAGRPQFDTEGEGTIITSHEHLGKYLSMLTSSIPIESQLGASASRLANHLNAEIISGTVSSIGEGVRWLSYTYLSIRMPKNPLVYGIDWAEVEADMGLHARRASLIEQAAKALDDARMCRYDPRTGILAPTDLGRVSSHFYVSHETVVQWNEVLENFSKGSAVTDDDWDDMYATVIHAISSSTEFEQMRSRQEEAEELDQLAREACPLPLRVGSETRQGKVAILLQAYISKAFIRISDLSYVVDSATRLLRAFFEISLRKGLPSLSLAALEMARASESRIWPFQHPLWQFTHSAGRREKGGWIQPETIAMIESSAKDSSISALRTMTREDFSAMIRAPKMVSSVQRIVKMIPTLEIETASVSLLSRTVLSIDIRLFPNFRWNDAIHGHAESWWLWIEDQEEDRVYHSQKILLRKRQVQFLTVDKFDMEEPTKRTLDYKLTVPVFDPPSSHYWVRIESDRWHTGRSSRAVLSLEEMGLPREEEHTGHLLDLRPLPVQAALPSNEASLFQKEMTHFSPLQTQAFHVAYHTSENLLLSAPAGSGTEIISNLGILSALKQNPSSVVVYLSPDIYALQLRRKQMTKFGSIGERPVSLLDSETRFFDCNYITGFSIILATPETWYNVMRGWMEEEICDTVSLLVFEEFHSAMSADQPATELLVARLRQLAHWCSSSETEGRLYTAPRIIALSEIIPNAAQVGDWLGVSRKTGLFCFGNDIREVPYESQVLGVAGDRFSSRMHSLKRPLYSSIQRHSAKKPVLIFVSSRRQALLTAQDLLRIASLDGRKDFLGDANVGRENIVRYLRSINDMSVQRSIAKGIAIYHEKLSDSERDAVGELYRSGYALVMVSTFKVARAFETKAHQVIVKGTEYFDEAKGRYEDVPFADLLYMLGKAGRPRTDATGQAIVFVHEPKKTLVKKILHERMPVESNLLNSNFPYVLNELITSPRVHTVAHVLGWLSWTLLFHRLDSNPGFYGMMKRQYGKGYRKATPVHKSEQLVSEEMTSKVVFCEGVVLRALETLVKYSCITLHRDGLCVLQSSALGRISAAHNISPQSVGFIASQIQECQTFEGVVNIVCGCGELAELEYPETDEETWKHMFDVATTEFGSSPVCKSRELAAQRLGVTGWSESPLKRRKLLCYSLHVDAKLQQGVSLVTRKLLYKTYSRLIAAGFEVAAEFGSYGVVKSFLFVTQSLYQGVPPHSDVWVLCGSGEKGLIASGRKAGWSDISDVVHQRREFGIFLAQNSTLEVNRSMLWWRIQNYPDVSISSSQGPDCNNGLSVDVSIERNASHRVADTLSQFTSKREGGYVLVASCETSGRILCVQRFTEGEHEKHGSYRLTVKLCLPQCVEFGDDLKQIRLWVTSDVLIGISAEAIVSIE